MEKELKEIKVFGASIHFKPDGPLPESLIVKIVSERLNEIQKK